MNSTRRFGPATCLVLALFGAAACTGDVHQSTSDGGNHADATPGLPDASPGLPDSSPLVADARPPSDADTRDIKDRLEDLPGVVSVTERSTQLAGDGYRFFEIGFRQPMDHENPNSPTFVQYLTLHHRDETAPFVLGTTGYSNYQGDRRMEPARLLNANQLVVEHRYFDSSIPAQPDWNFLTAKQSADDFHAIAQSFHIIYQGKWIGTGASKGGMTSIYHRRFWPADLDGTIAYVAPHSTSDADPRYDDFLVNVVPDECDQKLRALQVELLSHRRAMLESRTSDLGLSFNLVSLPAAVESAVFELEWTFWQYSGASKCNSIPAANASDDTVWSYLLAVSSPASLTDDEIKPFGAYYYQAYAELGYPAPGATHLTSLLKYGDADYAGMFPTGARPPYKGAAMADVAAWVKSSAKDIIFIYGQYDPWTGGAFDLGTNTNVQRYTVANGTHGANLTKLSETDRSAAFATIQAWTGVAPSAKPQAPGRALEEDTLPELPRPRRR